MTYALFDIAGYTDDWTLAERFIVPPFSTIDTRSGYWQTRRAQWDTLELDSTAGRDTHLTFSKNAGTDDVSQKIAAFGTTSTFDPVLAELIYRWWTPADGRILDPFAGGSVRGIVAATLGRDYAGIDLSKDQIYANRETAERLGPHLKGKLGWFESDSSERYPDALRDYKADAIVTCPPYGTLERYTDNPRDLSNMKAADFELAYTRAIVRAVDHLRDDRFAVFVVGNYREGGRLIDLVGMTVAAFGGAGADYYGDLILLNSTSSAGMRASASFNAGRKPIRTHQVVLVFVKGDWRIAAEAAERIDPKCVADE